MTRPAKPAPVQFYIDADVLGLAKILVQVRGDVTYPGDPGGKVKGGRIRAPCPITDMAAPDDVWIPETARQEWLIITRDRHIQEHRAEIAAVKSSGARLVTLAGAEAVDTFHQLEALMCNWRPIVRLRERPGPFICIVTRTTLRELPL
jgi:PIN like domain